MNISYIGSPGVRLVLPTKGLYESKHSEWLCSYVGSPWVRLVVPVKGLCVWIVAVTMGGPLSSCWLFSESLHRYCELKFLVWSYLPSRLIIIGRGRVMERGQRRGELSFFFFTFKTFWFRRIKAVKNKLKLFLASWHEMVVYLLTNFPFIVWSFFFLTCAKNVAKDSLWVGTWLFRRAGIVSRFVVSCLILQCALICPDNFPLHASGWDLAFLRELLAFIWEWKEQWGERSVVFVPRKYSEGA